MGLNAVVVVAVVLLYVHAVFVDAVVLLLYVHGEQLWSCPAGQFT